MPRYPTFCPILSSSLETIAEAQQTKEEGKERGESFFRAEETVCFPLHVNTHTYTFSIEFRTRVTFRPCPDIIAYQAHILTCFIFMGVSCE